jgi:tetratricopeptide (TPR) repeat protein
LRQGPDQFESNDMAPAALRLTAGANTATGRATVAHALLCDGQYDAALAEIEVALTDNPELAGGQLVKGLTLARKGHYREAIGPLQLALQSGELSRAAAFSLILVYLRLEFHDRAAQVAEELTRKNDRDALACGMYGEVLSRCNRPDAALAAYRRAAELDQQLTPVRLRLGEMLLAAGELEHACTELVATLRLAPVNARALQALASALRRRGQGEAALAVYRRATNAGQPTASLYLQMAECYLEQKLIAAAVSTARVAMSLDPQLPECHRLLGRIYAELGRHAEAQQYAAAADRLSGSAPSNADRGAEAIPVAPRSEN